MNRITKNHKIINDPLHGFIAIPSTLIVELIEHPYFQRLRYISQTGLSYLVYPGAHHTRFAHSLGCLHLMQKALISLKQKGIEITDEEFEATCIAILLHDIGHGPFSHALEESLVQVNHENISGYLFELLNITFSRKLDLAIQIFKGNYPKKFLTQLISSQLDIDRLDYLMRDSFYTGVTEGKISIDRLIDMMNVFDNELVIEMKGIYSVENFIIARQFMYWQVYLHKTIVGAELLLINILRRAKEVFSQNDIFQTPIPELNYFLQHTTHENLNKNSILNFLNLKDADILVAIHQWTKSTDKTLAILAQNLTDRKLYKIQVLKETAKVKTKDPYFSFEFSVSNLAYDKENPIKMLTKNGTLLYFHEISQQLDFQKLSKKISQKYFFNIEN